jgi:hypothetical protein
VLKRKGDEPLAAFLFRKGKFFLSETEARLETIIDSGANIEEVKYICAHLLLKPIYFF